MNHFQINITETKVHNQYAVELRKELTLWKFHYWFSCKKQISNLFWCRLLAHKWQSTFNCSTCDCVLNDFTDGK